MNSKLGLSIENSLELVLNEELSSKKTLLWLNKLKAYKLKKLVITNRCMSLIRSSIDVYQKIIVKLVQNVSEEISIINFCMTNKQLEQILTSARGCKHINISSCSMSSKSISINPKIKFNTEVLNLDLSSHPKRRSMIIDVINLIHNCDLKNSLKKVIVAPGKLIFQSQMSSSLNLKFGHIVFEEEK